MSGYWLHVQARQPMSSSEALVTKFPCTATTYDVLHTAARSYYLLATKWGGNNAEWTCLHASFALQVSYLLCASTRAYLPM